MMGEALTYVWILALTLLAVDLFARYFFPRVRWQMESALFLMVAALSTLFWFTIN